MKHLRALVAYDGSRFHGWQVQPKENTVQAEIERAIFAVTQQTVRIQGAGRTDAGVHGIGQVLDFEVETAIPPVRLGKALNAHLPPDIRIRNCEEAPEDFSARFSARWRAYEYVLTRVRSPFLSRHTYSPPKWPELEPMQECAPVLLGEHQFRAFTSQKDGPFGCHVHELHWQPWAGGLIFRIRADRFLYRMVRVLVGTFLQIGTGKRSPESLERTLFAADRTAAGPLAPAHALYLSAVGYRPSWPTAETGAQVLGPAGVGQWIIDDSGDAPTLPVGKRPVPRD